MELTVQNVVPMLIRLVFHTLEIQAVNGNVVIVAGLGNGEIMKKELIISRINDLIAKSKDKDDAYRANMYFGCALGFLEACSRMQIIDPTEYHQFSERLTSEHKKADSI